MKAAVAMAEAGLGFMIFPAIGDAYKGPLKAIPIEGSERYIFRCLLISGRSLNSRQRICLGYSKISLQNKSTVSVGDTAL